MTKVMLPYRVGERAGGGQFDWHNISHNAIVTIQSVVFKYVMVILPYRYV
jgi:hypothetical protein